MSVLGGSNKISALLGILSTFDRRVFLINSAHNRIENRRAKVSRFQLGPSTPVLHLETFTVRHRQVGKFLNLFWARKLARRLAREKPLLVWVYNGYAFDAIVAAELHRRTQCQVVLEVEDLHTSRPRGFNPKPQIDAWYLKKLLPTVSLSTCVNEQVCRWLESFAIPTLLLPGILSPALAADSRGEVPFSRSPYTLGYFGGLESEKGVDALLELLPQLPADWRVVVTGTGPLATECRRVANNDTRLSFFEGVSKEEVFAKMMSCDAIANPHKSITEMGNGIFPFKVVEALAAAKVLISTPLPPSGIDLSCVMWFDGSPNELKARLEEAPSFYARNKAMIEQTAQSVRNRYSEAGVRAALAEALPELDVSPNNSRSIATT